MKEFIKKLEEEYFKNEEHGWTADDFTIVYYEVEIDGKRYMTWEQDNGGDLGYGTEGYEFIVYDPYDRNEDDEVRCYIAVAPLSDNDSYDFYNSHIIKDSGWYDDEEFIDVALKHWKKED